MIGVGVLQGIKFFLLLLNTSDTEQLKEGRCFFIIVWEYIANIGWVVREAVDEASVHISSAERRQRESDEYYVWIALK